MVQSGGGRLRLRATGQRDALQLSAQSVMKLEIYNALGEKIATLIDETRQAGYYSERFDATGLASGLYFYRIQAGDYVDTKKLLLLK